MDCRNIDFSPTKSEERIKSALNVFPKPSLMRLLAFALHLLGAKRKVIAALLEMPDESVKTVVRVVLRDGFPAIGDRRRSKKPPVRAAPQSRRVSVRLEDDMYVVTISPDSSTLKIPVICPIQAKTVLFSLLNNGLLSAKEISTILDISEAHCRALARKLGSHDVAESLIDKRQGQKCDFRVGSEQKAEIIQQLAARAITGHSTSSNMLAEVVNEQTQTEISPRTIRWHINKLGLANIKKTLPELVDSLKKNV